MRTLFPIIALLLSGALFFVVVDPLYTTVNQLREDVNVYNMALTNSKNLQETQKNLLTGYSNISQEDKDKLTHFLPSSVNNIEFILEIEQIANIYNMPIKDIKFADTKATQTTNTSAKSGLLVANDSSAATPYGVFAVDFSTEGKYENFVSFMKDLEHNLRLVDVRHIDFDVPVPKAKGADGPDPSIFKYDLKVETYWLK